jgi:hypothetical protein
MESLCLSTEEELQELADDRGWIHVTRGESTILLQRAQGASAMKDRM